MCVHACMNAMCVCVCVHVFVILVYTPVFTPVQIVMIHMSETNKTWIHGQQYMGKRSYKTAVKRSFKHLL